MKKFANFFYFSNIFASILMGLFIFSHVQAFDDSKLFNSYGQMVRAKSISVRFDNDLCDAEKKVRALRLEKANTVLKEFTEQEFSEKETPVIGIVCSGGGVRAAIAELGILQGLDIIKILDSATYIASLSGSTWSTASWLHKHVSLVELEKFLKKSLYKTFDPEKLDVKEILESVFAKITSGKLVGLNDIWGGILGNVFLKTDKDPSGQHSYLSQLAPIINTGDYPFPIFTSIIANESSPYPWMEYTPFEVGSTYLEAWIPTAAFGKKFEKGKTTDARYEETLAYMIGLFGSAYGASVYDAIETIVGKLSSNFNIELPEECFSWVNGFWFGNKRIATPNVPNFTYKVSDNPLCNDKYLELPDAGIDMNLPFPPLFRRNIDVYIVCDASANVTMGQTPMQSAKDYAKKHYVEFPDFNADGLQKKSFDIIIDKNNEYAPVIIYIRNTVETSTLDFDYSEEDFNSVLSNVKKSVITNVAQIREAIKYALKLKANGYRRKRTPENSGQINEKKYEKTGEKLDVQNTQKV